MKPTDMTPVVNAIRRVVETHKIGPGAYTRWLWQDKENTREMGLNPYGCADAANILYTLNDFPRDLDERAASVKALQEMQGTDGLFHEKTHHFIHTTAHCAAAIELFDAPTKTPCFDLLKYKEKENLYTLLENLNWAKNAWTDSHQGAGIYVVMNLTGEATPAWNRWYFDWLWENTDPQSGFWKGKLGKVKAEAPLYNYMAGGFHYMFNHEYARMPLRYPDRVVDSCIELYTKDGMLPGYFGKSSNFLEIDWIFCLTRAMRQTPYRFAEARECLEDFGESYLEYWLNADYEHDETINDLHMLFGGCCALAELQATLRGKLLSEKPLRLVLDRRPFI